MTHLVIVVAAVAGFAALFLFDLSFPSVEDPGGKIGIDRGVFGVPESYFINAPFALNFKYNGELSAEVLETQIQAPLG